MLTQTHAHTLTHSHTHTLTHPHTCMHAHARHSFDPEWTRLFVHRLLDFALAKSRQPVWREAAFA